MEELTLELDDISPTPAASAGFQLLFSGIENTSDEALRKLKAALIVDLGLSTDEAREILSGSRTVVLEAEKRELLQLPLQKLQAAGASVSIITSATSETSPGSQRGDKNGGASIAAATNGGMVELELLDDKPLFGGAVMVEGKGEVPFLDDPTEQAKVTGATAAGGAADDFSLSLELEIAPELVLDTTKEFAVRPISAAFEDLSLQLDEQQPATLPVAEDTAKKEPAHPTSVAAAVAPITSPTTSLALAEAEPAAALPISPEPTATAPASPVPAMVGLALDEEIAAAPAVETQAPAATSTLVTEQSVARNQAAVAVNSAQEPQSVANQQAVASSVPEAASVTASRIDSGRMRVVRAKRQSLAKTIGALAIAVVGVNILVMTLREDPQLAQDEQLASALVTAMSAAPKPKAKEKKTVVDSENEVPVAVEHTATVESQSVSIQIKKFSREVLGTMTVVDPTQYRPDFEKLRAGIAADPIVNRITVETPKIEIPEGGDVTWQGSASISLTVGPLKTKRAGDAMVVVKVLPDKLIGIISVGMGVENLLGEALAPRTNQKGQIEFLRHYPFEIVLPSVETSTDAATTAGQKTAESAPGTGTR